MNNLPVPEPMNVTSDNVAENWSYFREQWNDYEIATGLREKDEKVRVANLRGIMGKDCSNIYKRLALEEEEKQRFTSILDGLEKHFKPALNVTYERFIFNICDQQSHETIDEYVNKVRGLSETCEFGTLRDSLIKDRIVLGTKNKQVRVTLLNQKELILEKALSVCRSNKLTEQHLLKINDNSTLNINSLQNVLRKEREWKREQRNCEYCGFKHAKRKCPAYGKICHKCNKKNHFANVCKTKAKFSVKSLDAVCDNTSFVFVANDHDKVCDSFKNVNFSEGLAVTTKGYNQIVSCTAIDETLQVFKATVLNGWPELKRDCPKLFRQYWPFRDEITTQDGILYKGQTVIIPTSMRCEMFEAIHYSHLGIAACLRRA